MERRKKENCSSYRGHKLFLSEDGFEVVRIDCGVASIPFFRIDVLLSSESIQFGTKMTRTKPDDKVELRKVLRPLCLPSGQYLSSIKILKVFIIHNNINGIDQTFQVVLLNLESFKDGKQFFIIYIVIQLCCGKSMGVKGNQMNSIFFINNGKYCSESIVQSISFYNELDIRNPISENGSRGKYLLERVESIMTGGVELLRNVLLSEACQWNDNVQIIKDKLVIEISKI